VAGVYTLQLYPSIEQKFVQLEADAHRITQAAAAPTGTARFIWGFDGMYCDGVPCAYVCGLYAFLSGKVVMCYITYSNRLIIIAAI
jgi:hypothetical protein